ncbi:hypothetical protein WA158_002870 [Blastocystis sp. Blastoise]
MAFITNPAILDDSLFESALIEAPPSRSRGRPRSDSLDVSSLDRKCERSVTFEESIFNHSMRVAKSASTIKPNYSPTPLDPFETTASIEERRDESQAINENKVEYLQQCMMQTFRVLILGESSISNDEKTQFLKGFLSPCDLTTSCHYDNTVNYYSKKVNLSNQSIILKVCNLPFELLNPINDYLFVYVKTSHIIILLCDCNKPNLCEYILSI